MFGSIFSFEVRRWRSAPAAYIYFAILFAIAFITGTAAAGTFDGVNVTFGGEKVFANSPIIIDQFMSGLGTYMGSIIIVAVIGNAVLKDFRGNTYSMIFTTPVSKFNYLFGRFTASVFVCLVLMTAPAFGLMAAYAMPWVEASRIGDFMLTAYTHSFVLTVIPNVFFTGAIFFAVSLIARDIFVIWLSLIIFFVAITVSNSYLSSLEHEKVAALFDPFGLAAKDYLTKYWTVYEKNHRLIPLEGVFLTNRILWVSVSIAVLIVGYSIFSFSASPRKLIFRKKKAIEDNGKVVLQTIDFKNSIPPATRTFTTGTYLRELWGLSVDECRTLLRNTYFRIIMLFGLLMLLAVSGQIGKWYDTATYPVTSQVVSYFGSTFQIFIVIITIMFAGELVWRARDFRMSNILDAIPVPNWVYYTSKLFGLWFIQAILLCVILIAGVIVQTYKGYTIYEILLYLRFLFAFKLINLWLLAVLCVMIQTLVNNKYVGYFVTVLVYLWNVIGVPLVLKHHLYQYGSDPGVVYSEMNSFGHSVYPFYIFKLYWASLALIFAVLSAMLWSRGTDTGFKRRIAAIKLRTARPAWLVIAACTLVFVLCGSFIYYNTDIENKHLTDFETEKQQARYEKSYKKFEYVPQPKITSVKLNLDLFPESRGLHAACVYTLKNKTDKPIDSVHVILPDEIKLSDMSFGTPAQKVYYDKNVNYWIYKLSRPMLPGDSLFMSFKTDMVTKGFQFDFTGLGTPIENGTFVNNTSFLPGIGYNSDLELSDNNRRKKHGLPYRPTANKIDDPKGLQRNVFFKDADFVDFDATVSTVPNQIAIAPGYLQREWTENGRRYFHYRMDSKILNFYSFLSARYQVKKEKWNNVNLEIYYQKGHEYNLDRMFNGVKKALSYYTTNFSPYQHRQVRILEFPRYATFAQSFPNTIPFSEGIGFIADVNDSSKKDIDYPFNVTAHEVAHQWFAHQVIGGDVEGSNMLSESLANYGAAMVTEKEFGTEKLRKYLHYEMDNYLFSRSSEREVEKPLAYVDPGQSYILYQKGVIVFNSLSKYIGEDSLNHAIKRFIQKYAFQGPPYPNTLDLISEIRKSTPDSLQYLVTDDFQKITLYNNKITDASQQKIGSQYKVDFSVDSKKLYADSAGKETVVPSDDYIEAGLYDKDDKLIALQRYKLKQGITKLSIASAKVAAKVVIDPRSLLIDKDLSDNEKKLETEKTIAKK